MHFKYFNFPNNVSSPPCRHTITTTTHPTIPRQLLIIKYRHQGSTRLKHDDDHLKEVDNDHYPTKNNDNDDEYEYACLPALPLAHYACYTSCRKSTSWTWLNYK